MTYTAGATLTQPLMIPQGYSVAIVGTVVPGGASARVSVDGKAVASVSTDAAKAGAGSPYQRVLGVAPAPRASTR